MDKSGFSQSIDRIKSGSDYDPTDAGYKRLIKRIETEGKIARKAAQALLDAGYSVSVYDGEETTVTRSTSIGEIMAAMNTTDDDRLIAFDAEGKRVGFVWFVYGNGGDDVISDYACSLEAALAPVNAYADSLAA
ncbi:hypothetical protein SAMN03159338_1499 [Sphingomonas sp. NFR04]|uniref:hypothetical protein n=1 Tax=Sphingomonas sp. NFR04 TaxID=1566283 RepID=UPI0008E4CB18|nr:hypothetical protein [Sphingomonas sp. NFR04]SFJ47639.1 hypothetical protein SAMN03159338_1499 [Sphingomonas sp. NFR04]